MQRASRLGLIALLLSAAAAAAAPASREALFRRALDNHSSAPSYVLITLISADGTRRREVCLPAPFLLGAIAREGHLEADAARKLALATTGLAFRFRDPAAIANVEPEYTEAVLAEIRASLQGKSRAELLAGFRDGNGPLDALYNRHSAAEYAARRAAVAHVLLERGLLPGHGDPRGHLTVQE
jgi:hypothetical protein